MYLALPRILRGLGESLLALAAGLGAGAVLIGVFGHDPVKAYYYMFSGSLSDLSGLAESLAYAMPLMLTGLAFAISVRAGLFNIGAEGQLYMGALGAVIFGGLLRMPPWLHPLATMAGAMGMGVLWSSIPAILKIYRGVHEVISTIMLNWTSYYVTMYLTLYRLADPLRAERSVEVLESSRLPQLVAGTGLTWGFVVAAIFSAAAHLFLYVTRQGFEMRIVGLNPDAARYAGIGVRRALLASFAIGGAAAGLAGCLQIIGRPPSYALYGTLGNVFGLGFTGIGVALIGRNTPLGIVAASVLYGVILNGGRYMEFYAGVSSELVAALTGAIVVLLSMPEILRILEKRLAGR